MTADTQAFVFMKPLSASKSRLAETLDPWNRELLAAAMLACTLRAATACPAVSQVTVVGGDETVRTLSDEAGALWRREPAPGLNESVQAITSGADIEGYFLYLPADLPLLSQDDLSALIAEATPGRVVIAPDRGRVGTNALLLPPGSGFKPALGTASLSLHLAEADRLRFEVRVIETLGLGLDVDSPEDLAQLLSLQPAWWETATAPVREVMRLRA